MLFLHFDDFFPGLRFQFVRGFFVRCLAPGITGGIYFIIHHAKADQDGKERETSQNNFDITRDQIENFSHFCPLC